RGRQPAVVLRGRVLGLLALIEDVLPLAPTALQVALVSLHDQLTGLPARGFRRCGAETGGTYQHRQQCEPCASRPHRDDVVRSRYEENQGKSASRALDGEPGCFPTACRLRWRIDPSTCTRSPDSFWSPTGRRPAAATSSRWSRPPSMRGFPPSRSARRI